MSEPTPEQVEAGIDALVARVALTMSDAESITRAVLRAAAAVSPSTASDERVGPHRPPEFGISRWVEATKRGYVGSYDEWKQRARADALTHEAEDLGLYAEDADVPMDRPAVSPPTEPNAGLRALAEAATPGGWYVEGSYVMDAARQYVVCVGDLDADCAPRARDDLAFIAACDPPTVLALIVRAENAEALLRDADRALAVAEALPLVSVKVAGVVANAATCAEHARRQIAEAGLAGIDKEGENG